MSILVLLFFFILWVSLFYVQLQNRIIILIVGTILFPTTALFIKSPALSPQHVLLYSYLFLEIYQNRDNFLHSLLKNPLSIVFAFICGSYFFTALANGGILSKDTYYGIRDVIDTIGYFIAAYIAGKRINSDELVKKLWPFLIVCCILGIFEGAINANYPYKFINSAFPIYQGLYDIHGNVDLSQSWRIRTCFTTKHPTAFGTLLSILFMLYLPYLKRDIFTKPRIYALMTLLGINIILCGSRTAIVCVLFGLFVYGISKFNVIAKVIAVGLIAFSFSTILAFMLANFQQGGLGRGSSLEFRSQQLLFSIATISNSPLLGNGNKYTSTYLFVENDKGEMRAEDSSGQDMGGLESIVFSLLIDRGFIGLGTYYIMFLWMFIFFYQKREIPGAESMFALVAAITLYLSFSGSIGNSIAFFFIFTGFQTGQIIKSEEDSLEDSDTSLQEIEDSIGTD